MSEAISRLERAGYRAAFAAEAGGVRCSACAGWHDAGEVRIDEIVRFEGAATRPTKRCCLPLTAVTAGTVESRAPMSRLMAQRWMPKTPR